MLVGVEVLSVVLSEPEVRFADLLAFQDLGSFPFPTEQALQIELDERQRLGRSSGPLPWPRRTW